MQICWIWQKVRSQDDRRFQRFLDSVEYNHKDILLYESVFGQGFVSTGGLGMLCHFHMLCFFYRQMLVVSILLVEKLKSQLLTPFFPNSPNQPYNSQMLSLKCYRRVESITSHILPSNFITKSLYNSFVCFVMQYKILLS